MMKFVLSIVVLECLLNTDEGLKPAIRLPVPGKMLHRESVRLKSYSPDVVIAAMND